MRRFAIATIVEGHGEVSALPVLVRRILGTSARDVLVSLPSPIRVPRAKLLRPDDLERYVRLASRRAEAPRGILLLLDADDGCPARLAPEILRRCVPIVPDVPFAVVVANREFESWFLAAARSLRGARGLDGSLDPPAEPESVQGAKEWLTERRHDGFSYKPTVDQEPLARLMDLAEARRAPSFDKLVREVERLVANAR